MRHILEDSEVVMLPRQGCFSNASFAPEPQVEHKTSGPIVMKTAVLLSEARPGRFE